MPEMLSGHALAMHTYLVEAIGDRGSVEVVGGYYPMFLVSMPTGRPAEWSVIFFGTDDQHETVIDLPRLWRRETSPWPEVRDELAETVTLVSITNRRKRRKAIRRFDQKFAPPPKWWPFWPQPNGAAEGRQDQITRCARPVDCRLSREALGTASER